MDSSESEGHPAQPLNSDSDFTPSEATTPDIVPFSHTESDSQLKRALKREGEVVVPAFPTMANLNSFKLAVVESVVMASARTDHHRVTRWIRRVEYPKIKLKQLADPGPHYESLDNKLAWALTRMADKSGEFARRIANVKRKVYGRITDSGGRMLGGRQILWILYKHFRTNKDMGQIFTIVDLLKVKWRGDSQIERFRNDWENMVVNMHHNISRDQLAAILLDHMKDSDVLKSRVERYKKHYPNERKSYTRLIAIIDRYLQEQRQIANRKALEQQQQRATATPVKVANCKAWLAGDCSNGNDCKFNHDRNLRGVLANVATPAAPQAKGKAKPKKAASSSNDASSAAPATPAPKSKAKAKAKSKGKGDRSRSSSKGKGQGKGRGKGKSKGKEPPLCLAYQSGTCNNANCQYTHRFASSAADHAHINNLRERSSSPNAERRPCNSWVQHGTCKHGNSCSYLHADDQKGTGTAAKGSGARNRSQSRGRKGGKGGGGKSSR